MSKRTLLDVPREIFNTKYPTLSGVPEDVPRFDDLVAQFFDTMERNILDPFDHFCEEQLRAIFIGIKRSTPYNNGTVNLVFTRVEISSPTEVVDTRRVPLLPSMAIYMCKNYSASIHLEYHFVLELNDGQTHTSRTYGIDVAIPIPTYSKYCNIANMSEEELHAAGIDSTEPKGLFIIDGKQFAGIINESVALSKVIIYPQDKIPYCRLMVEDNTGSSKLTQIVFSGKKKYRFWIPSKDYIKTRDMGDGMRAEVHHNKDRRSLNIYYVFRLLGVKTTQRVWKMLKKHIPKDQQDACGNQLIPTRAFVAYEIARAGRDRPISMSTARHKVLSKSGYTDKEIAEINVDAFIERFIREEVVPFLDNDPDVSENQETLYAAKVDILIMMLARFLRVQCGYLPYSDRNAVNNKRYRTVAGSMQVYIVASLRPIVESLGKIASGAGNDVNRAFMLMNTAMNAFNPEQMLCNGFRTSEWRAAPAGRGKGQLSMALDHHNKLGDRALANRTDLSVKRDNASASIRGMGQNGVNFVSAETPENKGTGLTKNLCMGVSISVPIIPTYVIIRTLKQSGILSSEGSIIVLMEGRIIGYLNGDPYQAYVSVRELRRQKILPAQLSISIQDSGELLLDYAPNRLLHPMWILNENEDVDIGDLTDDDLRDLTVEKAIELGLMEWIDPSEQMMLRVAPRLGDRGNKFIRDLDKFIKLTETRIKTNKIDKDDTLYMTELQNQLAYVKKRLANPKTPPEQLEGLRKREKSISTSIRKKEYEWSHTQLLLAQDILPGLKLCRQRKETEMKYTHALIDPILAYALASGTAPFANHMPPTRGNYQANMVKQCQSQRTSLARINLAPVMKWQIHCQPPICTTIWRRIHKDWEMGSNAVFAISTVASSGIDPRTDEMIGGTTDEDAYVYKDCAVGMGIDAINYTSVVQVVRETGQMFTKPVCGPNENPDRYTKITNNGYPIVGAFIEPDQCIVGLVENLSDGTMRNVSVLANSSTSGYVRDVRIISQSTSAILYVQIEKVRYTQEGDKKSPWCAQKGTIGNILSMSKLPYDAETGIVPDIFMNPHGMVNRSTAGLLWEGLLGVIGALTGTYFDATSFRGIDVEDVMAKAKEYGIDMYRRTMINPRTGMPMISPVYLLFISVQQLRHHIEDKKQVRDTGPIKNNQQPVEGKKQKGGLRLGEMERDTLMSSGCAAIINERLHTLSDPHITTHCMNCGFLAYCYLDRNTREIAWHCYGGCNPEQQKIVKRNTPFSYVEFSVRVLGMCGMLRIRRKEDLPKGGEKAEELVDEIEDE